MGFTTVHWIVGDGGMRGSTMTWDGGSQDSSVRVCDGGWKCCGMSERKKNTGKPPMERGSPFCCHPSDATKKEKYERNENPIRSPLVVGSKCPTHTAYCFLGSERQLTTTAPTRGATMDDDNKPEKLMDIDKHVCYILGLEEKTKNSDVLYFTDHKRLSGVYWAVCTLALLNRLDSLPRDRILSYVLSCYHNGDDDAREEDGVLEVGFSGNCGQDVHLLYTLSGVQILAIYDALDRIDGDAVATYVAALQNEDGSFCGDRWGEVDTRFTYCALLTLTILGRVDSVDVEAAVRYVTACQNFDGGFGCIAGAESHAGQVFCCVGALTLAAGAAREGKRGDGAGTAGNDGGAGDVAENTEETMPCALRGDAGDRLSFWLAERQLECGGFNGRPDKLEDVCYSWWVLSSLAMMRRVHFIDAGKLTRFIARCQDERDGGFADRPGDMPDVFHTFFGVAALSLLREEGRLAQVDATFALPVDVVRRIERRNRNGIRTGKGSPLT